MSITKKSAVTTKSVVPPSTQKKLNTSSERKTVVPSLGSAHDRVKILTTTDESIFE